MFDIDKYNQNLTGLEAAYAVVFRRSLRERVYELVNEYGPDKVDSVFCELSKGEDHPVPCNIPVSALYAYYSTEPVYREGMRQHRALERTVRNFLCWNDRNGDYDDLNTEELIEALSEVIWSNKTA